eukprot:3294016-Pleurochrysis_carterae.AAC.2
MSVAEKAELSAVLPQTVIVALAAVTAMAASAATMVALGTGGCVAATKALALAPQAAAAAAVSVVPAAMVAVNGGGNDGSREATASQQPIAHAGAGSIDRGGNHSVNSAREAEGEGEAGIHIKFGSVGGSDSMHACAWFLSRPECRARDAGGACSCT